MKRHVLTIPASPSIPCLVLLLAVGACGGETSDEGDFDNPRGFTAEQTQFVALGPGRLTRQGAAVRSSTAQARLADRQRRGLAADAADPQQDLQLEVTFHGDYTQGVRVATSGHPRAYVDVLPVGAQKAPGRLRKDGAVLAFEGAYPNVTSAFGASSTKVEEILVVQRPEEVPSLRYVMRSGAEPVRWDPTERGGLQAFTEQGRALYALVPPVVIDAQGKRVDGRWEVLERLPEQVTIEARLGLEGLTYPLTIDPTFEVAQWIIGRDTNATARGAAAATYNSSPGRECVVIFGGLDPVGLRNDLLLNCSSNWVPVNSLAGDRPPSPRAYAAMAEDRSNTNGDVYLFGGFLENGVSNDLYRLSYTKTSTGAAVVWTKLTPVGGERALPKARMMHGFAWTRLPSGSSGLMLWGGVDAQGKPLNDMWAYDPASNQWTDLGCGPALRGCPPSVYGPTIVPSTTGDLTLYQIGGYNFATSSLVDTVWVWDGSSWGTLSVNNAFLPTDEYDRVLPIDTSDPSAVLFDTVKPSPRYVGFAARTELDSILYGGGVVTDGTVKSDLWAWQGIYDPNEKRWQRLAVRQSTPSVGDLFLLGPRESPVVIFDEHTRQVLFFGGTSTGELQGSLSRTIYYKSQTHNNQGNATVNLTVERSGGNYLLRGLATGSPNGHEEAYFLQRVNGIWQEITGAGVADCFTSAAPRKVSANKPCRVPVGNQEAFAIRVRDDRYVIGGSGSGSTCNMPTVEGAQLQCNPSTSFQGSWACQATTSPTPTCVQPPR